MNKIRPIRVAALTGGENVPSARYRVRQLIPALLQQGIDMREFIPPISKYPPPQKELRPFWAFIALFGRLSSVIATYQYDVVLLQRELVSTLVTFEPFTKHPRVLDVDDAIFLHRRGKFAIRLARLSELIICGNDYLAEHFIQWNKNVVVIPTGIDIKRYIPAKKNLNPQDKLIIGWIGTSGNFKYLYKIELALEIIMNLLPDAILLVVADKKPKFRGRLNKILEYIRWSPKTEINNIQRMTVGIMPLADTEWERGKCSYKMLQYMACGIPVVVSPVGMNTQVLSLGKAGIGAKSQDEWVNALVALLSNDNERKKMGISGRYIVEKYFSIDVIAPRLGQQLKQVAS